MKKPQLWGFFILPIIIQIVTIEPLKLDRAFWVGSN